MLTHLSAPHCLLHSRNSLHPLVCSLTLEHMRFDVLWTSCFEPKYSACRRSSVRHGLVRLWLGLVTSLWIKVWSLLSPRHHTKIIQWLYHTILWSDASRGRQFFMRSAQILQDRGGSIKTTDFGSRSTICLMHGGCNKPVNRKPVLCTGPLAHSRVGLLFEHFCSNK